MTATKRENKKITNDIEIDFLERKKEKIRLSVKPMRIALNLKHLLCSDGISTVGKYTDGRRDDVRIPFSVLNNAKFCSLWLGRFFKNSLIDWRINKYKKEIHNF